MAIPRIRLTVPYSDRKELVHASALRSASIGSEAPVVGEATEVISLPIVPSPAHANSRSITPQPACAASVPKSGKPVDPVALVAGVYLAVAALLVWKLVVALTAVGRLRVRCEPVANPLWHDALTDWRGRLGMARPVALLGSDRMTVPIVVGWLRPAIILPKTLADSATTGLIDAVLLHELGHVRRGDFGWNLVRKLVQIVYWPHPLIWWVGRIIEAVREQACDDMCVYVLGGSKSYRASLVEVASGLVRRPEPASAWRWPARPRLGRRLQWIDRTRGTSRCVLQWPAIRPSHRRLGTRRPARLNRAGARR